MHIDAHNAIMWSSMNNRGGAPRWFISSLMCYSVTEKTKLISELLKSNSMHQIEIWTH